ncbi:hypothetical protein CRE_07071 [Caenorhabditis remanei]|uniref:Uncharacterized protein n=1 Tax=Caenorhabditis remanei TaxID=31234 RepID=E3NJG2_CAERE|nr:hypothetical protein CRE_07071 [Caenorhabditis remanei]
MAHRQNQKMIPAIPTTSLRSEQLDGLELQLYNRYERRVRTDKEQEDVDEKTFINKLIKEFKESLTPDGEGIIHIGIPHTGRQGELVDSSVVTKQRRSSLLGRHLQEKEAREAYQTNTLSWPTSASSNQARRSVLEAESFREERKSKQKVLDWNKAQEATMCQQQQELDRSPRTKSSNKTCCFGPSSASDNTSGQSAHPQTAQQTSPASGQNAPLGQPDASTKKQV